MRLVPRNAAVAVTGPRQSGKTTLVRATFPGKTYVSLEDPDERAAALEDPRAFLGRFPRGAIFDEVQRAPELLSYLQTRVDERRAAGQFILTGSQHFGLMASITQSLAGRVGLVHLLPFARAWLTVLEASYIVHLLPPHHVNFGKRLVKTAKLHFHDTGLAAYLLDIRDARQLETHPARGALFESLLIGEWLKHRCNRALAANAYFWRDNTGNEIDLLIDHGRSLQPLELKSGQTPSGDYFASLRRWLVWAGPRARDPVVVYGGDRAMEREGVRLVPWSDWP